ncbi:MAG: NAD-dependent epimerase/dehydratase family protein [Desulfocucumaceae bacterium]
METVDKIYVAGHRGLTWSALVKLLRAAGYQNLLLRTQEYLNLRDQAEVKSFFLRKRPKQVFLAAAPEK